MENNKINNQQNDEEYKEDDFQMESLIEDENKDNSKILKKSEFNNTDKDLKNGVSQDIPNMATPMQSFKVKNNQKNEKEGDKFDKIEEVNEGINVNEENNTEKKSKEKNENEEKKQEEIGIKEADNNDQNIQDEEKKELDKEKSEEIKVEEKKEKQINDENNIEEIEDKLVDMELEDEIKNQEENENQNQNQEENLPNQDNNLSPSQNKNIEIERENIPEKENIPENEKQEINQDMNQMNQNMNNYEYYQNQQNYIPIITIKDLQDNPRERLFINSPRSLKALYDSGYTNDELLYRNLDEFIDEHKEVIHISDEAKMNRYNFYEQLRLNKIENLVQYREQLIAEEEQGEVEKTNTRLKPMKNIIIDNHIRIAKEEVDATQKRHEKELANIIELELDKDLFNLEIKKQEENYNKEYEKLNFLNLNSNVGDNENIEENMYDQQFQGQGQQQVQFQEQEQEQDQDQEQENNDRYNNYNVNGSSKSNYRSLSFRQKKHIVLNEHNTYLDNLYSLQQAKINQKYEKNQKKIEKKLERVEKVNKIKGEQMALKKRIEVERASQNLQKNAIDYQHKHNNLVREILMKKLSIYQNKKKIANFFKDKSEMNFLKYQMKLDYIASLKRKDEYIRQLKYEKLCEKQSKRERIKLDRDEVLETKQEKMKYLNNDRKRNIIKIKNILDTGIDEENLEKILKAFPGNKDIDNVIKNYRIQREIIESGKKNIQLKSSRQRPKSQGKLLIKSINRKTQKLKTNPNLRIPNVLATNKNVIKQMDEDNKVGGEYQLPKEEVQIDDKVYYESELREKIKEFKENIYREFFRHVEDEKHNEDLRNKQLENVHDPIKRHELEKRFSKERALVDLRLKRENKNIEEKIHNFERDLRQKNMKNQKILKKKNK